MIRSFLTHKLFISLLLLTMTLQSFAQTEKKFVRQGNRNYEDAEYSDSEIAYRRALSANEDYADAVFNVGDALYRQDKYEDAAKQFQQYAEITDDKSSQAASMYNMGNSLLKANKFEESIDAYKKSLRLDPENMQAKYNLAYAQDMLIQQQQQQQQNQDQQDKEQQDNQDQQDNEQQEQNQNQQQDQQQDQQNQQEQQISQEDAERLLNALANEEKAVQEKVNEEKAKNAVVVGSGKNW